MTAPCGSAVSVSAIRRAVGSGAPARAPVSTPASEATRLVSRAALVFSSASALATDPPAFLTAFWAAFSPPSASVRLRRASSTSVTVMAAGSTATVCSHSGQASPATSAGEARR